ncbi:MAG: VanZ family protein [Planctomycetes bacterium]|nr:VanZ family protein [Planctomycetota bacterium]MCC7171141.1 VanZ family protein [Planctomycetota bacterium]
MTGDLQWAPPAAPLDLVPEPPRARERASAWLAFLGSVAIVLTTLDLAYEVSLYLRARGLMMNTVIVAAVLVGSTFFYAVTVGAGVRRISPFLRASLPLAIFLYAMFTMRKSPAERFHFVEYGGLALLALRAIAVDVRSVVAYPIAIVVAGAAGWLDEWLQGRSAVRYFDEVDLYVNLVAVVLAVIIAATLFGRDVGRARFPHLAARRLPE